MYVTASAPACASRVMRGTLGMQLDAVRTGRMNDEFKVAASQTLQLKEAIAFTERCVWATLWLHSK